MEFLALDQKNPLMFLGMTMTWVVSFQSCTLMGFMGPTKGVYLES